MVANVQGFYTCDGGCDKATIGQAYAKELEKKGQQITWLEVPKPAKLADGTVADIVIGELVANIELVTGAGTVVMPRTKIDVIKGPEPAFLLYLGKAEEYRLKFKSYNDQLKRLAKCGLKGADGKVYVPEESENEGNTMTKDNATDAVPSKCRLGSTTGRNKNVIGVEKYSPGILDKP